MLYFYQLYHACFLDVKNKKSIALPHCFTWLIMLELVIMEDSYLMYQINLIKFLFPLKQVCRILPVKAVTDEGILFGGRTVEVIDFDRLSGCCGLERPHVVILEWEDGIVGVSGGSACGMVQIPSDRFRRIPEEVSGLGRSVLNGAAYLEEDGVWAWRTDVRALAGAGQMMPEDLEKEET